MTTHYRGGRIFTAAEPEWAQSLVVDGTELVFVGDTASADGWPGITRTVELDGALVLPGFIDAHTHLVSMGQSLQQVDLFDAVDLADIQNRLAAAASDDPSAARILGRSWLYAPLAGQAPTGTCSTRPSPTGRCTWRPTTCTRRG